jgi:hypothetical protein
LGGWQVTGIGTARSGSPFSVVSGSDLSFSGINLDYADLVGDPYLDSSRPRNEMLFAFYLLNRPNFGRPENRQLIARFGEIMSASDPRIMQLALKLRF